MAELADTMRGTSWERVVSAMALPEGPCVAEDHVVDWRRVASRRQFAMARATVGCATDERLDRNRAGMAAAGLALRGLCHEAGWGHPADEAASMLESVPVLAAGECRVLVAGDSEADWCVEFARAVSSARPTEPLALMCTWSHWEDVLGGQRRVGAAFQWLAIAAYGHYSPLGRISKCRFWVFTDGASPRHHATPGIGRCPSAYFDGPASDLARMAAT